MMKIKEYIRLVTHNPWLNMLVFLAMLICAGNEIWQSIQQFELGAHHGVFLYALLQCLKSLPDLFQPFEWIDGKGTEN
jgi:hypothetical protein